MAPVIGACIAGLNFALTTLVPNLNAVAIVAKALREITQEVVFGIPMHKYLDIIIALT